MRETQERRGKFNPVFLLFIRNPALISGQGFISIYPILSFTIEKTRYSIAIFIKLKFGCFITGIII